jgi:hypothetical protein
VIYTYTRPDWRIRANARRRAEQLTLLKSDPDNEQSPLKVAVRLEAAHFWNEKIFASSWKFGLV